MCLPAWPETFLDRTFAKSEAILDLCVGKSGNTLDYIFARTEAILDSCNCQEIPLILARLKAILVLFLCAVLEIFLDCNWPDRRHSWILGRKSFEESGCAGLAGSNPWICWSAWTPANNIRFCFFHCSVSSVFFVIFSQSQMKTQKQRPNMLYIQNLMHILDK